MQDFRNLKVWETHYNLQPSLAYFLLDGLTISGGTYGIYRPEYPVWLVEEEPDAQQFVVALDPSMRAGWSRELIAEPFNPGRRYAETIVRTRLHQRPFRDRVLLAYGNGEDAHWIARWHAADDSRG